MQKLQLTRRNSILLLIGVLIGALGFLAFRFVMTKDDTVHYHANFALYINGQRDDFKSFTFYEEVAACNVHSGDPKAQAHMHQPNNHLVHVHAAGITWSDFFNNVGYTLGDTLIKTDAGVYITGQDGNKLSFILNGTVVDNVANMVIQSEDVLLINYGKDDDKTLQQHYGDIPRDAHQANVTADPAACGSGQKWTFMTHLKRAIGLQPASH